MLVQHPGSAPRLVPAVLVVSLLDPEGADVLRPGSDLDLLRLRRHLGHRFSRSTEVLPGVPRHIQYPQLVFTGRQSTERKTARVVELGDEVQL